MGRCRPRPLQRLFCIKIGAAARQRPQQRIDYTRFLFCLLHDQDSALINKALLLVKDFLIAGVQILLAILLVLGLKLVGAAGDAVNISFLPQAVQVGAVLGVPCSGTHLIL